MASVVWISCFDAEHGEAERFSHILAGLLWRLLLALAAVILLAEVLGLAVVALAEVLATLPALGVVAAILAGLAIGQI